MINSCSTCRRGCACKTCRSRDGDDEIDIALQFLNDKDAHARKTKIELQLRWNWEIIKLFKAAAVFCGGLHALYK